MKLLFLLALVSHAQAADPEKLAQSELKNLTQLCEDIRAEKSETCPAYAAVVDKNAGECEKMRSDFSTALAQSQKAVSDTKKWMAKSRVVNETEDMQYINFAIYNDPGYPLIDSDNYVNDALKTSMERLNSAIKETQSLRKKKKCRQAFNKMQVLVDGKARCMNAYRESLALSISDYLGAARRYFQNGAFDEATQAVSGVGITIKKAK